MNYDENFEKYNNDTSIEEIIYFETTLHNGIILGKSSYIDEWVSINSYSNVLQEHNNPHTQKYISIPLLTIMSRAAIYAGVSPKKVFDYYIECMALIDSSPDIEILSLLQKPAYSFCEMVAIEKGVTVRPAICRKCERFIATHIRESIKIKDIANYCGISERQIYRIFETNYQIKISEYINNEKLERASVLLFSTSSSISDISRFLGYDSQSYFTKKFSEKYHCTPREYRHSHVAMTKYYQPLYFQPIKDNSERIMGL